MPISSITRVADLTGAQRAAIVCRAIDPNSAATLLATLDPRQAAQVREAIQSLGYVSPAVITTVMEEYLELAARER